MSTFAHWSDVQCVCTSQNIHRRWLNKIILVKFNDLKQVFFAFIHNTGEWHHACRSLWMHHSKQTDKDIQIIENLKTSDVLTSFTCKHTAVTAVKCCATHAIISSAMSTTILASCSWGTKQKISKGNRIIMRVHTITNFNLRASIAVPTHKQSECIEIWKKLMVWNIESTLLLCMTWASRHVHVVAEISCQALEGMIMKLSECQKYFFPKYSFVALSYIARAPDGIA